MNITRDSGTYPISVNPLLQYRASGMQLSIHSDASYLSVSQAIIQAGGVHFLSKGPPNPNNTEYFVPTVKVILLVVYRSASEAEYGTIFFNSQIAVLFCTTLTEMVWKQVPMDIQVDNYTAVGIVTK